MPSPEAACPSPSAVKKAGSTLRKYMRDEVPAERAVAAFEVLLAYRAAHQRALATANMGLRSMVASEGCAVEVSQRLKRVPTIMDKLRREPTLPLSSMQDIGGVRAVLANIDEVRRVEARVKRNRPLRGYADYITSPRQSGYRGVHQIVEYRGRQIEIQLRTWVMHEWAITVERVSGRVGQNLKRDGVSAIQDLMRAISEAMAIEEVGDIVDDARQIEIARLRQIADPYLHLGGDPT